MIKFLSIIVLFISRFFLDRVYLKSIQISDLSSFSIELFFSDPKKIISEVPLFEGYNNSFNTSDIGTSLKVRPADIPPIEFGTGITF